jgi:hypothetical protein
MFDENRYNHFLTGQRRNVESRISFLQTLDCCGGELVLQRDHERKKALHRHHRATIQLALAVDQKQNLGGCIDKSAAFKEFADDIMMTFLGSEVQGIQAVRIARIDIGARAEKLENAFKIAGTSSTQETGTGLGLWTLYGSIQTVGGRR